jgi:hypothetical protein
MQRPLVLSLLTVVGLTCAWPSVSRASTSLKNGGSGYSGTLSSNPTTRTQQLLCDPTGMGSMSTLYDPSVVTLTGISAIQGFSITSAYVEVSNDGVTFLESASTFFSSERFGQETGYLQVFFGPPPITTAAVGGTIPDGPPEGFTMQGHAGVDGQNSHALFFEYLDEASDNAFATYFNYADDGLRGSEEDTLTARDENGELFTVHHEDISSAFIGAGLTGPALTGTSPVPLPSSAWAGLALMGGLGATKLRRRKAEPAVA